MLASRRASVRLTESLLVGRGLIMLFAWFDSLFPATCPVDLSAKRWVEARLEWLHDEFGPRALDRKTPIIEPTAAFFPDRFDGSEDSVRVLFERVCEYMEVDSDRIHLEFFTENRKLQFVNGQGQAIAGAAGTYEEGDGHFRIRIETSEFADPSGLVGTIAHELSHVLLLGDGRIQRTAFDNELATDLTVVFHGLGIFLANSPRNWDSQMGRWPVTNLKKPEYMSPPMFGYALAHLAWFRGEERPSWRKHLGGGPKANFDQGLRYLLKTRDSEFRPAMNA
jgi:hypothetical protein